MSWAARRRFIILLIIGAVVAAVLALFSFATFYQAPSCSDGAQNQDEAGIDCGGSCAYLCAEQAQSPTVLFTKAIQNVQGRTDVIAKVENKNTTAAAKDVPYRLTLYGAGQALIQQVTGTLDLPPGASVPIYVPGIVSGQQTVTSAFFEIASDAPRWFLMPSDPRNIPAVSNTVVSGSADAPRIDAVLTNASVTPVTNARVVVLVHNPAGDVIAASQTIMRVIPAQGSATATFTWNSPFKGVPASIEVVPIIPLPR